MDILLGVDQPCYSPFKMSKRHSVKWKRVQLFIIIVLNITDREIQNAAINLIVQNFIKKIVFLIYSYTA